LLQNLEEYTLMPLISNYTRMHCCRCNTTIAWIDKNLSCLFNELICDLCILDEWSTLRWLNLVNNLLPISTMSAKQEDEIKNERQEKSQRLFARIREYNLITKGDI